MNRKLGKYSVLSCILAVVMFMCGCGNGSSNSGAGNQKEGGIRQEEISYVTQSLSLPACDAFDAYSDGGDLYYIATQLYETAVYTLKQGAAEPEMLFLLPENQMVSSMTMDTEGNIYYTSYGIDYASYGIVSGDEEGNQTPSKHMLYKLDQNGVMLLILDLSSYTQGQDQVTIGDLAVDGEGRIVISASNQNIFVLDHNGQLLFETRADGGVFDMCRSNGKVLVGYSDGSGMAIKEIDIPGKKLSSKLEPNIPGSRFYMAADGSGSLLIAVEESVYRFDPETKEVIKKFDWKTYYAVGISAGILLPYGENGILAISRNYSTYPMMLEATAFREAAEGEVISQEKTVVTIGTLYPLPSGLSAEVVYFNKANPDISIEVKNYNEDYTRLVTEVMAGNGPDILVMPSHRINSQFAEKGVVEDLKPYLDGDEMLDRSDFLENVLGAFETEGHLYWMPAGSFTISTVISKTSVVGEESGWNLDELIAFAESAPNNGMNIFDNTSKSGVLSLLKYAYTNQLVDTDNTSNPLNRELLLKMLTFANRYENDDQYVLDTGLLGRIREEQVIIVDNSIKYGMEYFADVGIFGEPITFIGYPAAERNGNMILCHNTFAINSGSEYKDIAWKFISTLLSEEAEMRMVQDYSTMGFYMRKNVLEYHLEWCMGGNTSSTFFYTRSGNSFQYKFDSREMTDEDVEPIRNMILNANLVLHVSSEIDQIIEEEAALYFNGIKPIEEVVDVIENKVRTYVNEMK